MFQTGHFGEEDGTGLGLAFVARLADSYDWERFLAESEEDGARFEFTDVKLAGEGPSVDPGER